MYLLKKSGLVKTPPPKPTTTQRAVQLIDDTDLSRYANRNVLFDTGCTHTSSQHNVHIASTDHLRGSPMMPPPILDDSDRGHTFHYSNVPMIASKLSVSSMDDVPVSHGAMRPGGTAPLFNGDYIGLVLNWTAIGFVHGGTRALVRPLFTQYFHMQGYEASSALALLDLAWHFKFLLGFLSDSCTIRGERRRPYMFIGWSIVAIAMIIAACLNSVDAYFTHTGLVINEDAPSQGSQYLLPLLTASLGLLLVTVACEGIMVELAQREGQFTRGKTQCKLIMFRFTGEFVGSFVIGLSTNSVQYGGDLVAAMPPQALFGVLGFMALVGIVVTKFLLRDDDFLALQSIRSQSRSVWEVIRPSPVWRMMVFGFVCSAALSYDVLEKEAILLEWLNGDALALKVSNCLTSLGFVVAAWLIASLGINMNWRTVLFASVGVGVTVALPIDLLTTFDVARSLALVIVKDQLVVLCDALAWIVRELVIVEITPPGYEATMFSLLTTVYHVAKPVVHILVRYLSMAINAHPQDISTDTSAVKLYVAVEQITRVAVRIVLILLASPLLPRQKRHVKDLLRDAKLHRRASPVPAIVCASFCLLVILSLASNVLALVEMTACLPFAGGAGC